MILLAESGSTKCDWMLNSPGHPRFETRGLNPLFHSAEFMADEVRGNAALSACAEQVTHLYFYGAGCSSEQRKQTVAQGLAMVFGNAEIHVEHDLLGAVRATCGNDPGIVCILGTGSNSCMFDGHETRELIPALGYVLGDEAGGAWFGKELMRSFLYGQLPAELRAELETEYGLNREIIFEKVYRSPGPNVYLASWMKFLGKHSEHSWVKSLIYKGFYEFIRIHVLIYKESKFLPVHFVGSVAWYFRDILEEVCRFCKLKTGVITREPVIRLLDYHGS